MLFVAIVFFQAAFNPVDFDKAVTGVDDSANFPGVIRSTNCTHVYQPNVSGDALQLILDFVQGTVCMTIICLKRKFYELNSVIIFLSANLNLCFGCLKEPSH